MDFFTPFAAMIAKQGLGFLLFAITLGFAIWREKINADDKRLYQKQIVDALAQVAAVNDRRIQDLKDIQAASYERTKEERQSYELATNKIQAAIETIATMITNIQSLLSFRK